MKVIHTNEKNISKKWILYHFCDCLITRFYYVYQSGFIVVKKIKKMLVTDNVRR